MIEAISAEQVRQVIRQLVQSWHALPATALPAVAYWHEGPGWLDFWDDALPELPPSAAAMAHALELFWADLRAHEYAGQPPTPETIAAIYALLYGADEALSKYLAPYLEALEPPDQHVTWLLMHPTLIPLDFPMYRTVAP